LRSSSSAILAASAMGLMLNELHLCLQSLEDVDVCDDN
jgi:hypothetical protein